MHSQGKVTMGLAQVGGAVEVRGSGPLIKLSMRVPSSARMLRRQLQRRIVTPTLKKGNFQKKNLLHTEIYMLQKRRTYQNNLRSKL